MSKPKKRKEIDIEEQLLAGKYEKSLESKLIVEYKDGTTKIITGTIAIQKFMKENNIKR